MFGRRRKKQAQWNYNFEEEKVEEQLPVEMWDEIFDLLEPEDEFSVLLTCKLFNDIIKSQTGRQVGTLHSRIERNNRRKYGKGNDGKRVLKRRGRRGRGENVMSIAW